MLAKNPGGCLVVSVVSHGHASCVQALLWDLAGLKGRSVSWVVLTQNIPEPEPAASDGGWPFVLEVSRNTAPLGFGANHNRALSGASEAFVCVLNPDVSLLPDTDPLAVLLTLASVSGVGCAYPQQVNAQGVVQDSERQLPTPLALWRRRVLAQREQRVDWVNAACMVLPVSVWQALGGFNEAYFMYCEDVDLCLRLRQAGWALARAAALRGAVERLAGDEALCLRLSRQCRERAKALSPEVFQAAIRQAVWGA